MAAPDDLVMRQFTDNANVIDGGVGLEIADFVEDGHSVPIEVRADGAREIAIFALLNPTPQLAVFRFGRLSANQVVSTKIRLADSQDVFAIARMDNGIYRRAVKPVKVALGGCNV